MLTSSVGSMRSRSSGNGGFSLLEMLVVLVIIGLTAAVVIPAVNKSFTKSLGDVALAIELDMKGARSEAVMGQHNSMFWVDVGERVYGNMAGESGRIPDSVTVRTRTAAIADSGSRAGVLFFPDGSSSGGSLTIEQDGQAINIEVDWLTGRVVAREGNGI